MKSDSKFIILGNSRSGTSLLTNSLNNHDSINVFKELLAMLPLNEEYLNYRKDIYESVYQSHPKVYKDLLIDFREIDIIPFFLKVFEDYNGFKLLSWHIEDIREKIFNAIEHLNLKVILLKRNPIESHTSHVLALENNNWNIVNKDEQYNPSSIKIDNTGIRKIISLQENYNIYKNNIKEKNLLEIEYDLLVNEWDKQILKIEKFLNIKSQKLEQSFIKILEKPTIKYVKNLDHVMNKTRYFL